MIELTDSAQQQLESYFNEKEQSPVRIFLSPGGCSGPKLTLALDERRDGDKSYEIGGITYLVDKELETKTGNIKIDMTYYGFTVESEQPLGDGGSSCGSCSSGGSCCC